MKLSENNLKENMAPTTYGGLVFFGGLVIYGNQQIINV